MDTQKTPIWWREGVQPPLEEQKQHVQRSQIPPAAKALTQISPEKARRIREIRNRESKVSISERKRQIKLLETQNLLKALIEVTTSPRGQRKK